MAKWTLPDKAPAPVRGPRTLTPITDKLIKELFDKTEEQPQPTSLSIGMFNNYPK